MVTDTRFWLGTTHDSSRRHKEESVTGSNTLCLNGASVSHSSLGTHSLVHERQRYGTGSQPPYLILQLCVSAAFSAQTPVEWVFLSTCVCVFYLEELVKQEGEPVGEHLLCDWFRPGRNGKRSKRVNGRTMKKKHQQQTNRTRIKMVKQSFDISIGVVTIRSKWWKIPIIDPLSVFFIINHFSFPHWFRHFHHTEGLACRANQGRLV